MRFTNRSRLSAAVAALCLSMPLSAMAADRIVLVTEGAGGDLAAAQMKNWSLANGATVTPATAKSNDDEAAIVKANADATILILREVATTGAATTVSGSAAAKANVDAVAAALVTDAGKAEPSVAPTTMPAAVEANDDSTISGAGGSRVIVVSVPTSQSMPVSTRARALRVATAQLLSSDAAYTGTVDAVLPPHTSGALHIGIYDGKGSNNSPGPEAMWSILSKTDNVAFTFVGPQEINGESLRQFDLVMFPGGSGGGQGAALGSAGREAIRTFVSGGGAYIGNCAGAYLASDSYPWSLHMINVKTVNTENGAWARGTGDVQVELTDDGRKLLGDHQTVTLHYANGPIYAIDDNKELPTPKILAWYRSEIAKKDINKGQMVNTPAIVCAPFGKGRVVAFSCHPEYTKEYTDFIRMAVKWVTSKDATDSSDAKVK